MGYCPFYSKDCPQNTECEIWDTETNSCGFKRQVSLLQSIQMAGTDAIVSSPPSEKYKVTNLFVDPSTGKLTVEYDDTPI